MPRIDTVSQPGWRLDQVASAGRENLDAEHVARYDAIEDASPGREVALLQQWGLRRESVVVELGTGTGQFAIAAAHVCDRVVAVDVSPVMIAELQKKVTSEEVHNVDVVQAGFLDYEHRGAAADIVYSRYALHHLPDFWKGVALARIFEGLASFSLLFEPVSTDPVSIATLLFVNDIDDPSGVGKDDPPDFVRAGFEHIDGVIHWRVMHY